VFIPSPLAVSRSYGLSLQSAFHLSLTVLVCYRCLTEYLALDENYHPYSVWTLDQTYSRKPLRTRTNLILDGSFTLYAAPFQKDLDQTHLLK